MVGFHFSGCRIGTVAIFATLLVAIQVNGEKGCVFDFEHGDVLVDYDLECQGLTKLWQLKEVERNGQKRSFFMLEPNQEGCLRTRTAVPMNSTTKVVVRFNGETPEDENGLFKMILIPTEGSCASDKCVWIPKSSSQHMTEDGWRVAEYKFPLESNKEYNIQIENEKGKGKFELASISLPDKDPKFCRSIGLDDSLDSLEDNTAVYARLGGENHTTETSTPSVAAGLTELSKNLLLTSALVLMLNHLLI